LGSCNNPEDKSSKQKGNAGGPEFFPGKKRRVLSWKWLWGPHADFEGGEGDKENPRRDIGKQRRSILRKVTKTLLGFKDFAQHKGKGVGKNKEENESFSRYERKLGKFVNDNGRYKSSAGSGHQHSVGLM